MNRLRAKLFFIFTFTLVLSSICPSIYITEASQISQDSRSYQNYLNGLLFDRLGEYKLAKDAYLKALKFDFRAWDIHYRLGLDYLRLNDLRGAEREFKYVLKIRPYEEKVRFLLALVYSYRSKYRQAEDEFNRLLARSLLELDELDVRGALGHLHLIAGNLEKAEEQYLIILKNNPHDSDSHFYLGYIYHELAKTDNAIDEFVKAIEIDPENALALNSLSYVYALEGRNLDQAMVWIKKALEMEPSNGAYLDTLGWIYFKKGDLDNALRYLENASVLFEDAEVFEHLGDVYSVLGDKDKAKKNWHKALEMEPKRKGIKEKIKQLR